MHEPLDLLQLDQQLGRIIVKNKGIIYPTLLVFEMWHLLILVILLFSIAAPIQKVQDFYKHIVRHLGLKFYATKSAFSVIVIYIFSFIRYSQAAQAFTFLNVVVYSLLATFDYFSRRGLQNKLYLNDIKGLKLFFFSTLLFFEANAIATIARGVREARDSKDFTLEALIFASVLAIIYLKVIGAFNVFLPPKSEVPAAVTEISEKTSKDKKEN